MAIVHFVNYKRSTQSRAAMRGVMLYVMQEKKTTWGDGPLVSGINCQPQSVYDDFLNTKLLYHKDGGVMFYHMVQSFPKGAEVNPRQAHEAARRLAEYFDGCEVLVCTHVDREHVHSHCVINSVNFETGKKLHMAKEQIQELMRRNDAICQEMGLPVFDAPTQQARGMSGAEYHTALKGQSWKLRLMNTIDECMKYAADRDAFVSLVASEGYAVRWESGRQRLLRRSVPHRGRCRAGLPGGQAASLHHGLHLRWRRPSLGRGVRYGYPDRYLAPRTVGPGPSGHGRARCGCPAGGFPGTGHGAGAPAGPRSGRARPGAGA